MITNKDIDHGSSFDWGRAAKEYALYRDIYPPEFYERIINLGLCTKGQTVLDLGTGTGVLPRNLYPYGAEFVGADISAHQIAEARELSQKQGMDITYVVASAETIDYPASTFDVITACQCFLYFDKDIALRKIHHMLKPGGHFCVLWMAWLPDEDQIAGASEKLVLNYNPAWTGAGYRRCNFLVPDWSSDLFALEQAIGYDLHIPFTRDSWHGRMFACRGIGASSLSAGEVASFEKEHRKMLQGFPNQFEILHHVTLHHFRKR